MSTPQVGAAVPYNIPNVGNLPTGRPAQWAWSPDFLRPQAQTAIPLTGRRAQDYLDAEARVVPNVHVPRQTVWHHRHDYNHMNNTCTMQLVTWALHQQTLPHAGGCKQYSEAHGRPYRTTTWPDDQPPGLSEQAAAALLLPQYTRQDTDRFTQSLGLTLPTGLKTLYRGERTLSPTALAQLTAQCDLCLEAALPLTAADGSAAVAPLATLCRSRGLSLPEGAVPFALDPYGNWFSADQAGRLTFYDHETDTTQALDAGLADILE